MRMIILCLVALLCLVGTVHAQEDRQPRQLIEGPTAGLLPRGSFGVDFRFYEGNGLLTSMAVGLFDRAMLGISFGGQNVIGNHDIQWNPRLEFAARVRIIDENQSMPGIAIGYDSQGYGAYDEGLSRYASKSKGLYGVLSKNYRSPLGQIGVHAGMNRSFEDGDEDNDLSGFAGIDKQFGKDFVILAEYDFALNDNEHNSLGSGKGYMNAAVRWSISNQFTLEFDVKHIFQDGERNSNPDRELRLVYFEQF